MEVEKVLRMNGGTRRTSYTANSIMQRIVFLKGREILQESIKTMYTSLLPDHFIMADLGCSSGSNSMLMIREVIHTVHDMSLDLNRSAPEFQVFLNDLSGNDFNSLIKFFPVFHKMIEERKGADQLRPCFISVTPNSFYGRLFLSKSTHFFHSCCSIHFLSKVPEGLINEDGAQLNKGNIYIAKTSPPEVWKAYYAQYKSDFTSFLRLRSKEMVPGGCMVLTIVGSRKSDDPDTIYGFMGITLKDMVSEGLIDAEKLDAFNIPFYSPTADEMRTLIKDEGSFTINKLQTFGVDWDAGCSATDLSTRAKYVGDTMRAVAEPMLSSHFGEEVMDDYFSRFRELAGGLMTSRKMEFFIIIVALTRKSSEP